MVEKGTVLVKEREQLQLLSSIKGYDYGVNPSLLHTVICISIIFKLYNAVLSIAAEKVIIPQS